MSTPVESQSPYYSALQLGGVEGYSWLPPKDQERAQAYDKYEQLYWNSDTQFPLRVLEGESPVYIPNARTVVDTTSYYFLKGLQVGPREPESATAMGDALSAFLKRERFYSRFQNTKHSGVARGDFALHMTADPDKPEGKRISLTPVHPSKVILDEDPDDSTKIIAAHLVEQIPHPTEQGKFVVKELLYSYEPEGQAADGSVGVEDANGTIKERTVYRVERLWDSAKPWWKKDERQLVATTLPLEALPAPIDTIPVYMFTNLEWDGKAYGFSELRGFERQFLSISQVTTDQSGALSLEGLGVYATDGGAVVDKDGKEVDWEVSPGKVMEVPSGSYFRRVEGVGSVKPNMDHIEYLESKIREAGGLSDVALGRVDVQTAQSGIALAIKFIPTLAKLEERDKTGIDRLSQLFFDWKNWYSAYENQTFTDEIMVTIGDKLPTNRTERINELNNMLDRGVISKKYYRAEMTKLGYEFPTDIEAQIDAEDQKEAEKAAAAAPPGLDENAIDAATGAKPTPQNPNPKGSGGQPGVVAQQQKKPPNRSNNRRAPNESKGTEAGQKTSQQARGGKPPTR
jgi:hypothetical protein